MTALAVHTEDQQTQPPMALTPMALVSQAVAGNASIETMERLLAMQERWQANQARAAFNAALTQVIAKLPAIARTGTVERVSRDGKDAGTFKHETMQEIARVVNPILAEHGLSYRFRTDTGAGGVTVTCILMHVEGHTEENSLTAPFDTSGGKNNVQGIGSTQTYLQRYTLKAALGLAVAKDDDGETSEVPSQAVDWLECVNECGSLAELVTFWKSIWPDVQKLPKSVQDRLVRAKDSAKKRLAASAEGAQ